jgi:hypothetical protein
MLSFGVIIWCYYLFNVIIWCYHFSHFANVIIFVLSFFLVQHGCYHLCYHLMLSFFVIISPLFSFSWKRDTLLYSHRCSLAKSPIHWSGEYRTTRGLGFLAVGWFGSMPTPYPPLSRQYARPATHRKTEKERQPADARGGGKGVGVEPNYTVRSQEGLPLSINYLILSEPKPLWDHVHGF